MTHRAEIALSTMWLAALAGLIVVRGIVAWAG